MPYYRKTELVKESIASVDFKSVYDRKQLSANKALPCLKFPSSFGILSTYIVQISSRAEQLLGGAGFISNIEEQVLCDSCDPLGRANQVDGYIDPRSYI